MKSHNLVAAIALLLATNALSAVASTTILESATLGPQFQSNGPTVESFQYAGARFHVSQPTQVDHIGGFLESAVPGSTETIFGAIVGITSPTGFPSASPASFQPLAETTLDTFPLEQDLLAPLSVLLQPGDYALVFGSGRFGATGEGQMPRENHDTAQASYFIGEFPNISTSDWRNESGFRNMRFVVKGSIVPEPSTAGLLVIACAVALVARRR